MYQQILNWNCRLLSLSIAVMLQLFLVAPPAESAESNAQIPKYLQIPILYVTDRELTGDTFGVHRRYPAFCQHHMYYGTEFVTVRNDQAKSDSQLFDHLGWKAVDTKEAKFSPKDRIDPQDPEKAKAAFFDRVQTSLDRAGNRRLSVFVHGSIDAFEDASQDAAQLAYNLQTPLIMYSWPAGSHSRGYFIDGSNCEWSQAHFDAFWSDMGDFNAKHPIEVTAIAHSMGNRLLVRALHVVYDKQFVKNWELVSPDIDADTCRHYVMGLKPNGSKFRLYVSNRDKLLPIAQMLAGGYYRVGEGDDPIKLPKIWTSADAPFERIDFTAVDKGFEGHTIPSELIANIVNTNSAGPGLQLLPESEARAGRLEKFADRGRKLNYAYKFPEEFCKRVLRVEDTAKEHVAGSGHSAKHKGQKTNGQ
jgi:esterase/lipase superfamily enzyme